MNTDKIEYIFKTNVLARERLVGNLEKVLEDEIEHVNTSLKNTDFLQEIKNSILTSIKNFKPGEEVTMTSYANSYSCTKEGSKGRIVSQGIKEIKVGFYYQTGISPPNKSDTYGVDRDKACKTIVYDLFKNLGNYEDIAKRILDQAIKDVNIIDLCSGDIEKLVENSNVYLINDNALLEGLKQDSIYFKNVYLEGARKYLRGTGSVRVISYNKKYSLQGKNIEKILQEKDYPDYDSAKLAQAESSQALAELNIMEEAKKAGVNYVLINQKHIFSSDNTIISIIEGLPFMIIGNQEIENLLNKPNLEEDVITAIKNLVPSEMIKSNYTGFAKFYPEDFIKFFSSIESAEQKKMIIELLMKTDYNNKKVIAWLDENESALVREVGLKIV